MGRSFFDYDDEELDYITFDIETTGLKASDEITVVVFHAEDKSSECDDIYRIFLNLHSQPLTKEQSLILLADSLLIDDCNIEPIGEYTSEYIEGVNERIRLTGSRANSELRFEITTHGSEKELLNTMSQYTSDRFKRESVLVAYNGETYNGGFDLPFIRSRLLLNQIPYLFSGVWYTDLYGIFSDNLFNTTYQPEPSLDSLLKRDMKSLIQHHNLNIDTSQRKGDIEDVLKQKDSIDQLIGEWYDSSDKELGTESAGSLDDVYAQLFDGSRPAKIVDTSIPIFGDPLTDSKEAVSKYKNNEYGTVIKHCLSDVSRCVALKDAMLKYAPRNDYRPKIL
jgi:DNA polymerase III epsilon subunit-like protein